MPLLNWQNCLESVEKTAQRFVSFLVTTPEMEVNALTDALASLKTKLTLCSECFGITDVNPCPICTDSDRDRNLICVVEEPTDIFAIERSGQFKGLFHVLHGSLAPLDGVGPDRLKVKELFARAERCSLREVLLATNPDVEGEATALYLAKQFAEKGIPTSRIALGLPMGGQLEYADQVTLARAITERRQFSAR